ncbi:hypothetical protein [Oenococcus sicerae]|nr:hypothetical protein [Oenococcus sicerae]
MSSVMIKRLVKQLSIASTCWAVIFLIDYLIELFQINHTSTITTLSGLKIVTQITPRELNTEFTLTFQSLCLYLTFVVIWFVIYSVIKFMKKR